MSISGGCLCGSVRYECAEQAGGGHCHCYDCRKTSGTGHCTHMIVPAHAFKLTGALRLYEKPAESGNVVTRAFCPNCGSQIYAKSSGMPHIVTVRASSLDDPEQFTPQIRVFTAVAPSWDHMDTALPGFPGMPQGDDRPEAARAG